MSAALFAALEATWPPEATARQGAVTLRAGAGAGRRVSAATAGPGWTAADLDAAEAWMRARGQAPLFRVGPQDGALDAALAARGYRRADPTVIYAAPCAAVAPRPGPLQAFAHWPPLARLAEIWEEGGIGPARQAVMARAAGPKAALLARRGDRPAGAAFVALGGGIAMLHALEVPPELRRSGAGRALVGAAAAWAEAEGAATLALAVTEANAPARALYEAMGMRAETGYHYRALDG